MNKPKLLITMGCSFTEGEGCYDFSSLPKNVKLDYNFTEKYPDLFYNLLLQNKQRFHENGWPNKLGKKLNYDRVINLGLSGSSTSGQLKVFMEKYGDEQFEDYDVLLLWLLIDPSRFSFYSDMKVVNHHSGNLDDITEEYIKNMQDIIIDPLLEQMFYVKIMSKICKLNKWTFYFSHLETYVQKYIPKFNMQDHFISGNIDSGLESDLHNSPICGHPNENGYEIIANNFFTYLKNDNPNLINKNKVKDFMWEWNGEPLDWKPKFII